MKKYKVIYADPAWSFNNKNTGGSLKSGASFHYDTMTTDEMCKIPVDQITDKDCILFMWWVGSQPKEAIKLAESWGFQIKTMTGFNWVKTTKTNKLHFGMGFYTRGGAECCLIATKGKPKILDHSIRSVVMAENTKHSKKPDIFKDHILSLAGDVPRVELFARQETEGWDVWGNEVNNSISL